MVKNVKLSRGEVAVKATSAKVIAINTEIAIEAAEVHAATMHRDPGDCHLIATARVRRLSLMVQDRIIQALATNDYLSIVAC